MSGLFGEEQRLKPAKPDPPIALPEKGEGGLTKLRPAIRGGRRDTILAGELTPETRKKQILG